MLDIDYERLEAAHPCHGCGHREYCDPVEFREMGTPCYRYENGKSAYLKVCKEMGITV